MTSVAEENPLLEGLQLRRRPEPCVVVIYGASGDLAQRKLMPALYALAVRHLLPERFAVVGAARSEETDDAFRERMKEAVQRYARDEFRQDVWDELAAGMRYCSLELAERATRIGWLDSWPRSTPSGGRRGIASTTSRCRRAQSARS